MNWSANQHDGNMKHIREMLGTRAAAFLHPLRNRTPRLSVRTTYRAEFVGDV